MRAFRLFDDENGSRFRLPLRSVNAVRSVPSLVGAHDVRSKKINPRLVLPDLRIPQSFDFLRVLATQKKAKMNP
jgi:hypothetical protein